MGLSLGLACVAQTGFPIVKDVYNFSVGDTFEYRGASSTGAQWVYYSIIIERTDYLNDSIVYLSRNIRSQNHAPPIFDTSVIKITMLDSSVIKQLLIGWIVDSVAISVNTGDTTYIALGNQTATFYCDFHGQYFTVTGTAEAGCRAGLGRTYFYSCNNMPPPCTYCSTVNLIYVHKANGFVYGVSDNSFFTRINHISGLQSDFHLTPNPATTGFTISIDESLIGSIATLTDLTGREITNTKLQTLNTKLETGNLTDGIYFVTVSNGSQGTVSKLMVSR